MHIDSPGAFLDQFMRQTRMHHVQLSTMADIKANMMLTAASLVLTFTIKYLAQPVFQWAALTLIGFCFLSIVCAIYASMPKLPPRGRAKPDVNNPNFNLLFFGSFVDLEYEEYERAMEQVCNDHSKVYEVMTREIYTLGRFLALKKYRYLRWSYQFFLTGLIASGIVLAVTEILASRGVEIWVISL